jgi:predicted aspartyl protease
MMIRLIFVLVFSMNFFGHYLQGQTLGFTINDDKKKVQIPIQIQNNLVVVPIILNDVLPLKFIIDTGVRTAILTQKAFADILQLPYNRKYSIAGPGGEKIVEAYVTTNVSLTLPGVTGRGHSILVLEEDYLELRNVLGTDVHGILGYELFSRFIVEIDYEKKVMTLTLPEKFKKRRKFDEIPMLIEDTKPFILTPLTIFGDNALTAKLLIDTGASHGLLLDPASDERICVPENTVSAIIGRGIGGDITGRTGRIQELKLGHFAMQNVLVNFPDPNSYIDTLKTTASFRHGTIGGEILSRFAVVFNYPQGLLYLKKNSDFKKKFYLNLSGINLSAKGASLNSFEVIEVRKLSPAERAGIKVGDELYSVKGLSTKDYRLNEVNAMLNTKPGKKIKIGILRNGVKQEVIIVLESQI